MMYPPVVRAWLTRDPSSSRYHVMGIAANVPRVPPFRISVHRTLFVCAKVVFNGWQAVVCVSPDSTGMSRHQGSSEAMFPSNCFLRVSFKHSLLFASASACDFWIEMPKHFTV